MKSYNVTPLRDNIIVDRDAPERFTGTVFLPQVEYDDKTVTGTVIAIGPDVHDVKVLDKITFPKYCNKEFDVNGKKLLILRELEVFAVLP